MTAAALYPQQEKIVWFGLDLRWVYTDLLRYIFLHTKCMHLAHDVLHDSLLRFILSKHGQQAHEPHAYLRVVVRNLITDYHHEKSGFVSLDDENDTSFIFNAEDYWVPSTEHLVDLQQRMQALQHIINCLPAKCREVFWLFRVEGISQADIALRLNISVNMVERHVIRALLDIRAARDFLLND